MNYSISGFKSKVSSLGQSIKKFADMDVKSLVNIHTKATNAINKTQPLKKAKTVMVKLDINNINIIDLANKLYPSYAILNVPEITPETPESEEIITFNPSIVSLAKSQTPIITESDNDRYRHFHRDGYFFGDVTGKHYFTQINDDNFIYRFSVPRKKDSFLLKLMKKFF